jgi:hypothetical protein
MTDGRLVFIALIAGLLVPSSGAALDPHDVIDSLLPKHQLPRVLNSDDIVLNPTDPQPLFAPVADFTKDGQPDLAISGIYNLPSGKKRYFLLAAAGYSQPIRYEQLFFEEYEQPVFLHRPGTTGDNDPGTQSFAITFCSACSEGEDFFWNAKRQRFERARWVKRQRHYQPLTRQPAVEPDAAKADVALQVVGKLTDVVGYVAALKKRNATLGTTALASKLEPANPDLVDIEIYEKRGEDRLVYDRFSVNVASKTVVKRGRNVKRGGVSGTSR